jgi:hypothetical protein
LPHEKSFQPNPLSHEKVVIELPPFDKTIPVRVTRGLVVIALSEQAQNYTPKYLPVNPSISLLFGLI